MIHEKKRSLTSEVDVGRLFSKGVCRPATFKAYNREKYREILRNTTLEKCKSWEIKLKIPARVLPKILSFHFPENVNYCDARKDVSQAPDDESVQRAPLLSQVVVVAVQHEAVSVPPGNLVTFTSMVMLFSLSQYHRCPFSSLPILISRREGKRRALGKRGL